MSARARIDLAYDGAAYSGWARQPARASVQQALEDALAVALRVDLSEVKTVVAGRTDSGVHALGQVAHVDLPEGVAEGDQVEADLKRLLQRVRGVLRPHPSIVIHDITLAPKGFDARFSPLTRRYEYRVSDQKAVKDPRRAGHTLWLREVLNESAMSELGRALCGLHDWAAFCRARPGATTIRDLKEFSWVRDEGGVLLGRVIADAFCHSMVRSLVGAAVAVGSGVLSSQQVVTLRDLGERTSAWKTMPAHGLTLMEVIYPPEEELASRQAHTRAPRGPLRD